MKSTISLGLLSACMVFTATRTVAAEPEALFNGKDLTGWRKPTGDWMAAKAVSLDPADQTKFVITPGEGVLVNGPGGRGAAHRT